MCNLKKIPLDEMRHLYCEKMPRSLTLSYLVSVKEINSCQAVWGHRNRCSWLVIDITGISQGYFNSHYCSPSDSPNIRQPGANYTKAAGWKSSA